MVQQENGGLWTHGTVVGSSDHNHNNRSYTIRVTKQAISSPETGNTSTQHPSQLNNTSGTNLLSIQMILWTKYENTMNTLPIWDAKQ